jgi:hypothetical protein
MNAIITTKTMSLFTKAENTSAYLKMAAMGLQGSGKTFTATDIAIGMVKLMRERGAAAADRPIFFGDTEMGSDWVAPRIKAEGIELLTAKTRAFKDLLVMVQEAERDASVLVIDSLTHFWVELTDAYMKAKKDRFGNPRTRLQFEDWAFLKAEWRKFTDLFVNSNLHIIACGRAGFEYETTVDDDTGKKNLEKTGIKFKAESEMGYEPSLLVLMERHQEMDGNHVKRVYRTATVLKDRSTLLDGKVFEEPKFANFLPHVQLLNIGGRQLGVDTMRSSVSTIPADTRDTRSLQRKIVLDEIESLLVLHYPGQSAAEKKTKLELLRTHFQASWTEIETLMSLERLRVGFNTLYFTLEKGKPSKYAPEAKPEINDELPGDLAPPKRIATKPASDGLDIPDAFRRVQPQDPDYGPNSWIEHMQAAE